MAEVTDDTFAAMMKGLREAGEDLVRDVKGDAAVARKDMREFIEIIETESAQAFATALANPNEKTHRDTLMIQVDRVTLRTLKNLDNLSTAVRQRLRGAAIAAFRVALALA